VKLHFMVEVHYKVYIHQLEGPFVINTIFTAGLYSYDSKNRKKHSIVLIFNTVYSILKYMFSFYYDIICSFHHIILWYFV
jgi:hypothetical protein